MKLCGCHLLGIAGWEEGGEGLDAIDKELFEVRAAVIDDDQNITSGLPHACVSSFS